MPKAVYTTFSAARACVKAASGRVSRAQHRGQASARAEGGTQLVQRVCGRQQDSGSCTVV